MATIDNVNDAGLKSKTGSAIADGSVTYQEMLDIFSTAKTGGMTSAKFNDLKTIYSLSQPYFTSDYVSAISKNLIYGNTANSKWWGGTANYNAVTSLGNLADSTSQGNVEKLINKWFMGTDLPMPLADGDAATGKTGAASYSYKTATGPLFVSGVAASDVNQGYLGDCYYVAALGSIAHSQSAYITNMFTDNQNGTYGVKYYINGSTVYTTINKSLPVDSGSLIFAGNQTGSTSGELWVSLAEKAYAQLNSQADLDNSGLENNYSAIGQGGLAAPIKQITNLNYKYYSSYYNDLGDPFDSGFYTSSNASAYKQTIINALNNGAIGWLGSFGKTYGSNGKLNLVSGHAFMLLGYNSATDKFILRNPWGGDGTDSFNVQFEVPITDFWNSSVKGVVALSDASTQDTNYSYSLSTDSGGSSSSAASEGTSVKVTVTRSSSGTASTVYITTEEKTAGGADYSSLEKYAIAFGENQTVKTFTINTLTDSQTEGTEYFNLQLFKTSTTTTPHTIASVYIKDTVSTDYAYALTSNALTTGNAIAEGDDAAFTITRDKSGSVATVYVSTQAGTAGSADYSETTKQAVTFAANELTKTVYVNTLTDSLKEGTENFSLLLFKNYADDTYSTKSQANIKDPDGSSTSNYKITSSASQTSTAVSEGAPVTLTITRPKSSSAETVYISTSDGTANSSDYVGFTKKEVYFAPNQILSEVTISTNKDWWLESPEYFNAELYKKYNDTTASASVKSYIKDDGADAFNYSVSSSASNSNPVAEGGDITFTITRNDSGAASTVYVSTTPGSAGSSDYSPFDKQAVTFGANETTKTITVSTLTDSLTEGSEYFNLDVYRNYIDSSSSAYASAYIKDATVADYSYTLGTSASSTAVTEGGTITLSITRSGSGTASTVYISTAPGTAGTADYTSVSKQAVNFAAYETTKTFTIATLTDSLTEGNEYFWLNLYKNAADSDYDYASYTYAYIQDATAANYSYTVSSSASSSKAVSEGSEITFTIKRSGSGSASTVYVSTTPGSAGASDYTALDKQAVTFGANETTKTITVNTLTDSLTEGNEYFWLDLYKNAADTSYSAYASAYIKDTVSTSYTYTLSTSASNTSVTEGSDVTFTITRSSTGSTSTVYLSTAPGTAGSSDYTELSKQAVTFGANETTKTVTVSTLTDSLTEGNEYFWLNLYKNAADSDYSYSSYAYAYIQDAVTADYSYTVSSSASSSAPVAEGGTITFTVTRSGSGSASTVYVSTTPGSAGASDYTAISKQAVSFSAYETAKTVTVNTLTDALTEGDEYFWFDLFKNAADTTYSSFASAYIKDTVVADYSYTVSSSASSTAPVAEGGTITFTITRSGSGAASTVYVSTESGTAGTSDYTAVSKQAVSFGANETTKTVTVSTLTDALTEGNEYFWLNLYKNAADSDDNYASYASAYIKDTASTNYSYTLSTSASSTPVAEGSDITFTITRSGSGAASTVYVSTAPGTAGTSDYTPFTKKAVSFGANETTKTVTVSTLTDALTEGSEYLWLNLYKNAADSDYSYSSYAYAYIKDTVAADYSYTVSSSASSSAPVAEGGTITFTITRSGSGSASTVYVSTTAGSAGASDYTAISKQAVSFSAYETTKTVTVNTLTDALTEGEEYFWFDLFKNAADTTYSSFASAYIKDTVVADYSYTVSSSASSTAPVAEGGDITFTITRSGSGAASTVYVSTESGTAGTSDYTAVSKQAVSFGANETTKTVTVSTLTDSLTEGNEYFWLNLYKNAADSDYNYASYASAYIKDTISSNYSYTISSSASSSAPVAEGSEITFTIKRSGSGSASTVYVSTESGTAGTSDYTSISKQAVSFGASETTKTVTVSTLTDALSTEGNEYFWLNLYKNAADTTYATYASAYIKDVVTTSNFDYTVTSNYSSTAVTEGGKVTFTITRSGSGSASTVYVSTTPGSAGAADYTPLDKQAVSFGASETTKTVTVSTLTDAVIEGSEYFWLDLFKNSADTTYTSYGYAYITDGNSVAGYQSALTVGSSAIGEATASMIELAGIPPGTHF